MIDINQELEGEYHGTSQYSYLVTAPTLALTDGAIAACQKYGLAYFIEEISALSNALIVVNEELKYFQAWKLRIENAFAILVCEDEDCKEVHTTSFGCNENFPDLTLELFLINKVLLLPSEY